MSDPAVARTLTAVLFGLAVLTGGLAAGADSGTAHDPADQVTAAPGEATLTPVTADPTTVDPEAPTSTPSAPTSTPTSVPTVTETPSSVTTVTNESEGVVTTVTNESEGVVTTVTNESGEVVTTVTNESGKVVTTVTNESESVVTTVTNESGEVVTTVTNESEGVVTTVVEGADTTRTGRSPATTDGDRARTETGTATETIPVSPTASAEGTATAVVRQGPTPTDRSTTAAGTADTSPLAPDTRGSRTPTVTSGGGAAGPPVRPPGGSSSGIPSRTGAAVGGAVIVGGVALAAASRHVATTAASAQGGEFVYIVRVLGARARETTIEVRARLARLPRVVLPIGYSRYDDSDPLEHETRTALFERIEQSPGVTLSELADSTDGSMSTVRYHLRILESEHLLTSERIRGRRRYFPRTEQEPALVAALDDDATARILHTLARIGPASTSDLADELGRDPSTISHHLSRLEDDGIVERERDGRAIETDLAPVARRALAMDERPQRRPMATD